MPDRFMSPDSEADPSVYDVQPVGLAEPDDDVRDPLPLQARIERGLTGITVRLPVRAEHVTVEKQTVIAEEVVVRTGEVTEVERLSDTVRREELRVDTEGDLETVGQADPPPRPGWRGVRQP